MFVTFWQTFYLEEIFMSCRDLCLIQNQDNVAIRRAVDVKWLFYVDLALYWLCPFLKPSITHTCTCISKETTDLKLVDKAEYKAVYTFGHEHIHPTFRYLEDIVMLYRAAFSMRCRPTQCYILVVTYDVL